MPQAITELAAQMLRNPARVAVTPAASTVERVDQRVIRVDRGAKPAVLVDVLKREPIDRALIFTRTKHGADKVVRGLVKAGIAAEAIHGNKSQGQRERVLAAFRRGDVKTLVATDIAARGIDVDGISHVVNFDLPNVPETYVHRIGRTARAGADGIAISLCDSEEAGLLRDIEKLIRKSIPATDRRAHPGRPDAPASRTFAAPASGKRRQRQGGDAARSRGRHEQHNGGGAPRARGQHEQHGGSAAPSQRQRERAGESSGAIASVAFLRRSHQPRREQTQRAPRLTNN
jgi:superfamily II DNA/RNA helicase